MRNASFFIFAIYVLVGLGSCTEHNTDEPKPEVTKNFTGCRLVKIIDSDDGFFFEYVYDNNNNIVRENSCSASGAIGSYDKYDYDAQGRITSSENFDLSKSASPLGNSVYQYNSADMLVSEKQYQGPGNSILIVEYMYHYDVSGKVDSSWVYADYPVTGILKPQTLTTYGYDGRGNLMNRQSFSITKNANGTLAFTQHGSGEQFLKYDNFKNPLNLKSYTLRQLSPFTYFTRNNCTKARYDGTEQNTVLTYRPDSLALEYKRVGGGPSYQFIYDCN